MKSIFALTGGIACGKSTVAKLLEELGAAVVDADQIGRDMVAQGTPGLAQIVDVFGKEVVQKDGSLDRAALGKLVFGSAELRKKLEAITHPLIFAESVARFQRLENSEHPYIVYEAALLVEGGRHKDFSALIVVAIPQELQLSRLMSRDNIDLDEAQARIDSQFPIERKVELADYIIENDKGLAELTHRVKELHRQLCERAATGLPSSSV